MDEKWLVDIEFKDKFYLFFRDFITFISSVYLFIVTNRQIDDCLLFFYENLARTIIKNVIC